MSKINFEVFYYNLYNIEDDLDSLLDSTKLLVELFNSSFNGNIDPTKFNEDKLLLEELLNSLKDKFNTIMILNKKTNQYDLVPFVILQSASKVFIIYNNTIISNENIVKDVLNSIDFNINDKKIKRLKDDEIVAIDYSTGASSYIYDNLLLINQKFNIIEKTV